MVQVHHAQRQRNVRRLLTDPLTQTQAVEQIGQGIVRALVFHQGHEVARDHQHQAGMRLLALLGVVFAVLMGLRSVAAALGLVESSVSSTLVNSASVLAAGMSLIGGVVGLVLVISGDLMALVEHQRTHDPLTDLLNRLGLRQWVGQQASDVPLALGMVDLDHFKQVNDTHGHALGDQVIRHLALLLKASEFPDCRAARLGGEEFVIVALGPDQATPLLQTLEQLRMQFQQGGPLPGNTLSAGMARGHVGGFEGTLREADAALYRAKQAGRNRVESAQEVPIFDAVG